MRDPSRMLRANSAIACVSWSRRSVNRARDGFGLIDAGPAGIAQLARDVVPRGGVSPAQVDGLQRGMHVGSERDFIEQRADRAIELLSRLPDAGIRMQVHHHRDLTAGRVQLVEQLVIRRQRVRDRPRSGDRQHGIEEGSGARDARVDDALQRCGVGDAGRERSG